jgi:hypothetical protein
LLKPLALLSPLLGDAFATLTRERVNGLVVSADPFFMSHRDQLVALALRHSIPAVYYAREFAAAGGLISYASSFADSFRLAGLRYRFLRLHPVIAARISVNNTGINGKAATQAP